MGKLSDRDQALLLLVLYILTAVTVWTGMGMPTDKASLALLLTNVINGIILFIKEILGGKPPELKPAETTSDCPSMRDPQEDNPKLSERVAVLENDIGWMKEKLKSIDNRAWYILGSVVVLGVLSILTALYH